MVGVELKQIGFLVVTRGAEVWVGERVGSWAGRRVDRPTNSNVFVEDVTRGLIEWFDFGPDSGEDLIP